MPYYNPNLHQWSPDNSIPPPPPPPSASEWRIQQLREAVNAGADPDEVPPPPPPPSPPPPHLEQHATSGALVRRRPSNSLRNPFFDSSGHNSNMYGNTSLAGFPIAGQYADDGGVVSSSEFRANSELKPDGVQHEMFYGWKRMGESGQNSKGVQWFEKRSQGSGGQGYGGNTQW